MKKIEVTEHLLKQTSDVAANFTIGFGGLSRNNSVENVASLGSGTLASVGLVKGIVTASHVIEALPDDGNIGLILHSHSARPLLNMSDAFRLKLGGEASGKSGPDLGFLRIPLPTFKALNARLSVYDLIKERKEPAKTTFFDAAVGIVSELTEELTSDRVDRRITRFRAIFGPGSSSPAEDRSIHDYFDFNVESSTEFTLPTSFGGVSGGAIWRFYTAVKNDVASMTNYKLVGVPYFETVQTDGKIIISCHGTQSIYDALVGAIKKEWADWTSG